MFLREIPKVLEGKRARRTVEVLSADPSLDCPAVSFSVGYVDPKRADMITSKYRKKDGRIDLEGENGVKFKQDVVRDAVLNGRGSEVRWFGLTANNIRRMCPVYMEHPELLPEVDANQELDLQDEDIVVLAGQMHDDFVLELYLEAQKLSEYAREQISKKKN